MPAQPGDVVEVAAYGVEEINPAWGDPDPDPQRPQKPEHEQETVPPDAPIPRDEAGTGSPGAPAADTGGTAARPDREHHEHHHHHHHHHHHREREREEATGFVEVDGPDLEAAADALRRWSAELQSVAAGLGTVRAGMGLSSIQPLVEEAVGRQADELNAIADELLGEATELSMRAQLASDELNLGGATPAPEQAAPATAPTSGPGQLVESIVDALTGDDDDRAS